MVVDVEKSVASGEMLFTALDIGKLAEANDILNKIPESVAARDNELRVPLHYAADCADIATFKRIFEMERSLMDAQDHFGFTPLLVAAMAGNTQVLEFLISQASQVDRDGHSAVHWAVVCGQLDVLIALLGHEAPLSLADIHGAHPLHYATVNHAETESQPEVPLECAEAILHVLLKHGAQLECTDLDGRTPLIWAASCGNLCAFRSLIQAGANRFATDRDGLGVLHCAACHGHLPIVQAMLDLGNHWVVNARDRNGDTPLFFASAYGHLECVKLLLESGADPNHQDKRIRTPAHCAAAKAQLRVLKLLRQHGASLDLQNYRGDLPIHEAVHIGSKECVEWMLGIEPNFVNSANFFGRTQLHLAAASGNMEMVVLLCKHNASPNPLMIYKGELLTPLDVAKRRGNELIVDYLTTRYDSRFASELSAKDRNSSKQFIEEQIKTARLRKVKAELINSEEFANSDKQSPKIKRGISMLNRLTQRLSNESSSREGVADASTMVSFVVFKSIFRRSSSASAIFGKIPKATSTTDLNNHSIEKFYQQQKALIDLAMSSTNKITNETLEAKESEEKEQIHETKIDASNVNLFNALSTNEALTESLLNQDNIPQAQLENIENKNNEKIENLEHSSASTKKVRLTINTDLLQPEDNENKPNKRIRRRQWTPLPPKNNKHSSLDEAVTELHILEEGLSPTYGYLELGNSTTRYIHEKAIFDELTHLKKMQIQYGKVREEVLVRSLVQNFCRMHAIHPAHFRRICSLQQWEKFLYDCLSDQLKMIYLEERERLTAAATLAAKKAAAAGMRQLASSSASLYSAQQRVFVKAANRNILEGRKKNNNLPSVCIPRVLAKTPKPLEKKLQELERIYNGRNNTIATTNNITNETSVVYLKKNQQQKSLEKNKLENKLASKDEKEEDKLIEKQIEQHKRCEFIFKLLNFNLNKTNYILKFFCLI
ncbi:hypothetical protein Mgra_00003919 [Meloidogyne graminicola]|uniref:ANK_REP_REGION domain-containing protein n=1 Tax=Meloidogyne graminicola TaxID=189291 RepID=A0A8S9ZU67_9BILA|nr:hypothetical protein Mgra_00003919 [Meloidogyne graminicola]